MDGGQGDGGTGEGTANVTTPRRMVWSAILGATLTAMAAPEPARAQFEQTFDQYLQQMQQQNAPPEQQQQQQSAPAFNPVGDPTANALRQIDFSKQLQEKAMQLQDRVKGVIYTVKLYQALNGAIWYRLGLQLNELHKLDKAADVEHVQRFVAATKEKRVTQQAALNFVSVNAVEDLHGLNHTIANNNAKILQLRQGVETYADALAGAGTFDRLVMQQNVPLNDMMKAYLLRVDDVTATLTAAVLVFDDMSAAYDTAMRAMDQSITLFDEQGGLLTAELVKQGAVIALEINNLHQSLDSNQGAVGIMLAVVQGVQVLQDLTTTMETLNGFSENFTWFNEHSQEILAASRGARQELRDSLLTVHRLRALLTESWQRHISAARDAAATQRIATIKFEKVLNSIQSRASTKGRAIMKEDMTVLNTLMAKPRLRAKTGQ